MKLEGLLLAAMLAAPTAAFAAPGLITARSSLRAGPGPGFPTVGRIPAESPVNIHGCVRGAAWCDISWDGDRGWVSARHLEALYRKHYVYLPDYAQLAGIAVEPFVLRRYWASYYAGRPWYHRRDYWTSYWHSHGGVAAQASTRRDVRTAAHALSVVSRER